MSEVRTLLLRSQTEIAFHEIPCLRGAVIHQPGVNDVLFHNHIGNGFRYGYPLVQYKRIGGCAAMFFIGEGTEKAADFFKQNKLVVSLSSGDVTMEISDVEAGMTRVQLWNDMFQYHLRKYMPLNQHNYKDFILSDSLVEKYSIIENTLIGNILSFAKGIGLHFDSHVEVKVTSVSEPRLFRFKGVKMMGFDLEFKSNVSLPDYIGLGKGVSLGYGVIKRQIRRKL